jgi:hypothetical protein
VSDIDIGTAYIIIVSFLALAFGICYFLLSRGIGIRE